MDLHLRSEEALTFPGMQTEKCYSDPSKVGSVSHLLPGEISLSAHHHANATYALIILMN